MGLEKLLKAPRVAWPTIALWTVLILTWLGVFALGTTGLLPLWTCTLVSSLVGFWIFAPYHDASHGSVARNRWVNKVVGHGSAVILMAPFAAWIYAHLEHHKHTNDPVLDPDHYAGRGPKWLLPIRWLTLDIHFNLWMREKKGGTAFYLSLWGLAAALMFWVGVLPVIFCWLLPARLTTGIVTLFFSYLPHYPHRIPASQDRYQATRILLIPGLTPLLLYHNFHLIHHLYPGVPFYRYRRIYEVQKRKLRQCNAAIWPPMESPSESRRFAKAEDIGPA